MHLDSGLLRATLAEKYIVVPRWCRPLVTLFTVTCVEDGVQIFSWHPHYAALFRSCWNVCFPGILSFCFMGRRLHSLQSRARRVRCKQ